MYSHCTTRWNIVVFDCIVQYTKIVCLLALCLLCRGVPYNAVCLFVCLQSLFVVSLRRCVQTVMFVHVQCFVLFCIWM